MNNFISFSEFQKNTKGISSANESKNAPLNQSNLNKVNPKVMEPSVDKVELTTEFEKAKRQNGLIEKIADKIKGLTGLGLSSKKLQQKLDSNSNSSEIKEDISKYRAQQENTSQAVADTLSCLGSIGAFFGIKQKTQKFVAKNYTFDKAAWDEAINSYVGEIKTPFFKKAAERITDFAKKNLDKKSTAIVAGAFGAMVAGSFIKKNLLKINRIGTSQYKPLITEDMDKKEIKQAKKDAKKARKNANRRNSLSGAINGLMTPLLTIGGGLMAPVYVIGNSLNRYFVANREDKGNKSIKGYVENVKSTPAINAASAAVVAVPAFMKGKSDKVFSQNFEKVVKKLEKAQLAPGVSSVSTYKQLENVLFSDPKVAEIMEDSSLTKGEQIEKLSDYNIFAVKFKQINLSTEDELAKALKTDCPPTRTKIADGKAIVDIDAVQKEVEGIFGKKYKVEKCVGVGTVAETYLAKDESGKEVCIKMIKKGIDEAKIDRDKDAFIQIINSLEEKTAEEKEFLIKNIENIAQGVRQEVNLANEMAAAKELTKVTHKANVVKPIEVKDNIYVMEKASGVNLSDFTTFMEQNAYYTYAKQTPEKLQEQAGKLQKNIEENKAQIRKFNESKDWYEAIVKKHPELKDRYHLSCPKDLTQQEWEKFQDLRDIATYRKFDDELRCIRGTDALSKDIEENSARLKELSKYLELRQDKNFASITSEETQKMLEAYQDVLVEQFYKIDGTDKIIHGDIHPGNVFIDLKALKNGEDKFLTLIDTGNTIKQTPDVALRTLNLTKYIENADTENIVDLMLEGARLPEGLSKDEARKKVLEEINKVFFDDKTQLDIVTTQSLIGMTDSIMQKLNIIPSDTQGNLLKSKQSAHKSMLEFMKVFLGAKGDEMTQEIEAGKKQNAASGIAMLKNIYNSLTGYAKKQKKQEKINLKMAQAKGKVDFQKSPSTPKRNSEEYLTYLLKQGKTGNAEEDMEAAFMNKILRLLGLD